MASIIFDISIPGNNPFELLYLAGGDPLQNSYVQSTTTLTNTTVTQIALDQALFDLNAGVVSTQTTSITNEDAEDLITITDVSLALLGDAAAILKLQTLVATTAPLAQVTLPLTPPTSSSATTLKNNNTAIIDPVATDDNTAGYDVLSVWINTLTFDIFICVNSTTGASVWTNIIATVGGSSITHNISAIIPPTVTSDSSVGYSVGSLWYIPTTTILYICASSNIGASVWVLLTNPPKTYYSGSLVASTATTLFTNIPFVDSAVVPSIGFTNLIGVLTSSSTGLYYINVNISYLAAAKYELQQCRIVHNGVVVGPIIKQEAGKISFNGSLVLANYGLQLMVNDTISIQYMGTFGTVYDMYIDIKPGGF